METTLRADLVAAFEVADRQRARELREVLDQSGFGVPGSKLLPEALVAAQRLLDLGFPYAFELTPEELMALRSTQRGTALGFSLLAGLGVLWVVLCGLFNVLGTLRSLDIRQSCGLAMFAFTSLSAVVALAAGFDVFRLIHSDCDPLRAARRLLVWSAMAVGLFVLDQSSTVFFEARHYGCCHGWANAGWMVPFTLPLALWSLRRFR